MVSKKSFFTSMLAAGLTAVTIQAQDVNEVDQPLDIAPPKGVMQVDVEAQSQRLTSLGLETDKQLNAVGLVGGVDDTTASGIAVYNNGSYLFYFKGENGLWYNDLACEPVELEITNGRAFYLQNRTDANSTVYFVGAPLTTDPGELAIVKGMQLVGPLHSSAVEVNSSQLMESGALSSETLDGTSASLGFLTPYQQDLWLSNDGWKNNNSVTSSLLSTDKMLLGRGYWLNSVNENGFLWSMTRPYADLFSTDAKPAITNVDIDTETSEATLTIDSTSVDSIIVLSQDVVENGSYDPTSWEIASETLSSASSETFTWSETLPLNKTDAATFRFWTAIDATKDADQDGLPDGVEQLVTHTSPVLADSDYDGINDADEFSKGTDPNKNEIPYRDQFSQGVKGSIGAEYWFDISGTSIVNLTASSNFLKGADQLESLESFEISSNRYNKYGTRIRGYLYPPTTGEYTFWIASDDNGELYLSTDVIAENKVQIANVSGWSSPRQWDRYTSQQSTTITLEAGKTYYIEALMKEDGGGDNLAAAWQGPGIEKSVIAGQYLSSFIDNAPVVLPAGGAFAESVEITLENVNPQFDYRYTLDGSEPSNNSILFLGSFVLESTTTVIVKAFFRGEPVSEGVSSTFIVDPQAAELDRGLSALYYNSGFWDKLPDFKQLKPYQVNIVPLISFNKTGSVFANSGRRDVAALFTGYIYIPASASYTFYLDSDDGSKLFIDNELVVDNDGAHGMRELSGVVALEPGLHKIAIEYFDFAGSAGLFLNWSSSTLPKQTVPSSFLFNSGEEHQQQVDLTDFDGDGLTDKREIELGTDPKKTDSDGDQLDDFSEVEIYLTDPNSTDTDNDGFDDYTEAVVFSTNANIAEFGEVTDLFTLSAGVYSNSLGEWVYDGSEVYSKSRSGYLEYTVNLGEEDTYLVELIGREGKYDQTSEFDVTLFVDGEYVFRNKLTATLTEYGTTTFMLPPISAGQHTLRFLWDNATYHKSLRLKSMSVKAVDGADSDGNGIKDWYENRLNAMCSVDGAAGSEKNSTMENIFSKTSPACIEGRGHYLQLMDINNGEGDSFEVNQGAGHSWFTNIDLDKMLPKNLNISFQRAAKTIERRVTWQETNLFEQESEIMIRRGDSLLLNAHPVEALEGFATITANGVTYNVTPGVPVAHRFVSAGIHRVSSFYMGSNGETEEKYVDVEVIDYQLSNYSIACVVGMERSVDFNKVPTGIVVEADPRLKSFYLQSVEGEDIDIYKVLIDRNEKRYIVARAGDDGPIFSSVTLQGTQIDGVGDTYFTRSEVYDDGTTLMDLIVVAHPVVDNLELRFKIFLAGVIFEDGTTDKTLTSEDFNELGEATVRFVNTPTAPKTAACHHVDVYENGVKIGKLY